VKPGCIPFIENRRVEAFLEASLFLQHAGLMRRFRPGQRFMAPGAGLSEEELK